MERTIKGIMAKRFRNGEHNPFCIHLMSWYISAQI